MPNTVNVHHIIRIDMILGGFALFIFGIKFMGDGLKSIAGEQLRDYIDRYTSKPLLAVFIGIIATILIQSSSATTAITIGLVRAGLMKLEQAAPIVMGANIGTTVTAFLISLKVDDYALYFIFVGAMITSFASRKKHKVIGEVILGFGLLFFGLKLMGDGLKNIKDLPQFTYYATMMSNQPLLSLLAGTVMTAIVQGSAATIGVVQKIYESGGMTFAAVLPFVYGSNIGTTITGIIAALGGSLASRRTAGIHTLFNCIGTLIGMILLKPFVAFILNISTKFNISPMMQIAVSHIIFNVATTIVFYPFLKQMCNLIKKIIPGDEPEKIDVQIETLDPNLAKTLPTSALVVSKQAVLKMGNVVEANIKECQNYFNLSKITSEDKDLILQSESLINQLDKKITDYLMIISKEALTEHDMIEQNIHLQIIKNLERIGDLSINLVEFFEMVYEEREIFSDDARTEINDMFSLLDHMLVKSLSIVNHRNYASYTSLLEDENQMDLLEYTYRQNHFKRMSDSVCVAAVAGSVFCDILGTLERMADHCCNIAKTSITEKKDVMNDDHNSL